MVHEYPMQSLLSADDATVVSVHTGTVQDATCMSESSNYIPELKATVTTLCEM
jgi:hypothetical protein